jgi:hypothetical protein
MTRYLETLLISVFIFITSVFGCAQILPDAPQPQYLNNPTVTNASFKPVADSEPKHNADWFAFAGVLAFEQGAQYYDNHETVIGIRHGVGVEANAWLLGTRKPTFGQLERRELLVYVPIVVSPSIIGRLIHNRPLFFSGLTAPVALGAKHIQGGNAWYKLLHGQAPTGSELGPGLRRAQ